MEHLNLLCIADRDNGRVICIPPNLKSSILLKQFSPDRQPVYGVAAYGKYLLGINGVHDDVMTEGFLYNPIVNAPPHHWGLFRHPHAITSGHSENNLTSVYVAELGTQTAVSRIRKYVVWEI